MLLTIPISLSIVTLVAFVTCQSSSNSSSAFTSYFEDMKITEGGLAGSGTGGSGGNAGIKEIVTCAVLDPPGPDAVSI